MTKPSQIDARFFLSVKGGGMETFIRQQTDMVSNNMFNTFFLLKDKKGAKALEAKFPAFVEKYMRKGLTAAGFNKKQYLMPLKDIHLRAGMSVDISPVGSVTYLYILASIASLYPVDRLHQFYEPVDRAFFETFSRSGRSQSTWC